MNQTNKPKLSEAQIAVIYNNLKNINDNDLNKAIANKELPSELKDLKMMKSIINQVSEKQFIEIVKGDLDAAGPLKLSTSEMAILNGGKYSLTDLCADAWNVGTTLFGNTVTSLMTPLNCAQCDTNVGKNKKH